MRIVSLLAQENCAWREKAKDILQDVSAAHPLVIEEVEPVASAEGRDLALRHGVAFAPGILLDGQMFSFGRPPERKLRRRLSRDDNGRQDCQLPRSTMHDRIGVPGSVDCTKKGS